MGTMNLTFKGFLRGYCRELTGVKGDNLQKMLAAVVAEAPAAAEAVMVFAAEQGKATYLANLAQGTWVAQAYVEFAKKLDEAESIEKLLQTEEVPERYRKVWLAWRAHRDAIQRDRRVISLMRDQTQAALANKQATAYSLCKLLGLNRGNFYAYLRGDVTRVSRATARRILETARAMQ